MKMSQVQKSMCVLKCNVGVMVLLQLGEATGSSKP